MLYGPLHYYERYVIEQMRSTIELLIHENKRVKSVYSFGVYVDGFVGHKIER